MAKLRIPWPYLNYKLDHFERLTSPPTIIISFSTYHSDGGNQMIRAVKERTNISPEAHESVKFEEDLKGWG